MTPTELLSFTELFYSNNIAMMRKKNADYTAGNTDAHANFKALEMISGIEGTTEQGMLHRMMDKFMRIVSFVKDGNLQNESVIDSLADLANYAALLAALIQSKNNL